MDQRSSYKHFCRICKKGFGCGRALGGHMRAHGIGDESWSIEDDDVVSDWEVEKLGGDSPLNNKRMYSLRTNPNRLKSCRVCENCGEEFSSWKSFLEHGKCGYDAAESLVSSPGSGGGWSKRKRSMRAEMGHFNSEEEELANCLMMLSNATVVREVEVDIEAEAEESCASASKEDEMIIKRKNHTMNFIAPIACRVPMDHNKPKGLFECKACKKVFNSHQALGGHRASHKKVKGCFAARLDHFDKTQQVDEDHDVITHEELLPTKSTSHIQLDQGTSTPFAASTSKKKLKVHECSICHRVFSSGQALGGHKRCHWVTSNSPDTSSLTKFHRFQDQTAHIRQKPKLNIDQSLDLKLDLNLPATTDLDLVRRNHVNPYLQPFTGIDPKEKTTINNQNQVLQVDAIDRKKNDFNSSCLQNADDEADSKVKLAKLCELKGINVSGGSSSPWLQVGISSDP